VNGSVYNQAGNECTMYSAPSPYDEPTKPIDVQTLRAWWVHQRKASPPRSADRIPPVVFDKRMPYPSLGGLGEPRGVRLSEWH
jgi:hypothetical protein